MAMLASVQGSLKQEVYRGKYLTMFPLEYINRGQCTWTCCSVSLWSDMFHCKNLCNLPCGKIVRAWWQGNAVHVEMDTGWHFVYEDFGTYASRWKI